MLFGVLQIRGGKFTVRSLCDRKRRGCRLLDRDGLVRLAGDAYGKPEAEHRRLIGPMPNDQPA